MKSLLLLPALFITLFSLSSPAQYDHGNGGDMCENRFKEITADLQTWILKGGAKSLRLPEKITLERYTFNMLKKIQKAEVSCTKDKLLIGKAEKTCKNFVDEKGVSRIVCNSDRFMETDESNQYILVHHEFAGLAEFEVNSGETSNYYISNQITAYLETQLVKKLVVRPSLDSSKDPFDSSICQGEPLTYQNSRHLPDVFAEFQVYVRERECTLGGCGPWERARNHLPPPDMSKPSTRKFTPATGQISLATNHALSKIGIHLSSTERDLTGEGAYIVCRTSPDVQCNIVAIPSFEQIGQATGVITPHCLRLTYKPQMFEADKAYFENKGVFKYAYRHPLEMPNIWIEQEKVFISRY